MTLNDRIEIPLQVTTQTLGEELVILDLASGTYFGLDPVGARVWELMTEGLTLSEICDRMQMEYEVARADLEHDVLHLAAELQDQHLIRMFGELPTVGADQQDA
jgi:hypothetical protein